ncbi:MAG: hypothetical protein IPK18_03625 [Sphingobacteriales bacterium]|nr:MAG: hypothetical protein IPK18_03625 [Sphingobacteriales bacterium]
MNNDSVKWDIELLDKVDAKIDWSALWKIKTIKFDIAFSKDTNPKSNLVPSICPKTLNGLMIYFQNTVISLIGANGL